MILIPTNAEFPRFLISHYGRYWSGREWVDSRKEAMVYDDAKAACRVAFNLEKSFKKITTILTVPTQISITSPYGFELREMKNALVHHVHVQFGQSPLLPANAILNMIHFDWNQTKVELEDDSAG